MCGLNNYILSVTIFLLLLCYKDSYYFRRKYMKTGHSVTTSKWNDLFFSKSAINFLNIFLTVAFIVAVIFHFYVSYYSINLEINALNDNNIIKSIISIFFAGSLMFVYFVRVMHIFVFMAMFCIFKIYLGMDASILDCALLAIIPTFIYWCRDYLLRYMTKVRYF